MRAKSNVLLPITASSCTGWAAPVAIPPTLCTLSGAPPPRQGSPSGSGPARVRTEWFARLNRDSARPLMTSVATWRTSGPPTTSISRPERHAVLEVRSISSKLHG